MRQLRPRAFPLVSHRSVWAFPPGCSVARVHPDQAPATGLLGLRSWRQQTAALGGASIVSARSLRITTSLVSIYPSSRLSQSARLVITISTLTLSQKGSLRATLARPGGGA